MASLLFVDAGHATYDVYRECAKHCWIAPMGNRRATYLHRLKDKPVHRFYSPRRKVVLAPILLGFECHWHSVGMPVGH